MTDNHKPTLWTLPPEIRHRIYRYYFGAFLHVFELHPNPRSCGYPPEIHILQFVYQNTHSSLGNTELPPPLVRASQFFQRDTLPFYCHDIVIANNCYTPSLGREPVSQDELKEMAKLLHHDVGEASEKPPKTLSAFDMKRYSTYIENRRSGTRSLTEIIPLPLTFLRSVKSITGLDLEDLSDKYLQQHSGIYEWLDPSQLPKLERIGFERRAILWHRKAGQNDDDYNYNSVVTKILKMEEDCKLRWERALVHWNTHPTIHFVTRFYALNDRRTSPVTPVIVDHRAKSVTWETPVALELPFVRNLWFPSHQVEFR